MNKDHFIRVGLWISDNKDLYDKLFAQKDEIETEIGYELDWDRFDGKKSAIVCIHIPGLDFDSQDNYPELMDKCIENVVLFKKVFSKRI